MAARTKRFGSAFALALLASASLHLLVGEQLVQTAALAPRPVPPPVEQPITIVVAPRRPTPPPVERRASVPKPAQGGARSTTTPHRSRGAADPRAAASHATEGPHARRPSSPPSSVRQPPALPAPAQNDKPTERLQAAPTPAPRVRRQAVDLRRAPVGTARSRVVLGPPLPLQPSVDQLERALTAPDDRVTALVRKAAREPLGTASLTAHEQLGTLVRRLDTLWGTLANDRLRSSQLSGVMAFVKTMSEGRPAWERYQAEVDARRSGGDVLEDLQRRRGPAPPMKIGEHLELVVQLQHDERGDVTAVDVVESSGDPTFDEQVRLSFLEVTATHRPQGNDVRTSRVRLVADARVAIPRCGAGQDTGGRLGPSARAGADATIACALDFDAERGVEVPWSTQVSGSAVLEAAEMR